MKDSAGINHLKKLSNAGISHVHLLPTFQFGGVDDDKTKWKFVGKCMSLVCLLWCFNSWSKTKKTVSAILVYCLPIWTPIPVDIALACKIRLVLALLLLSIGKFLSQLFHSRLCEHHKNIRELMHGFCNLVDRFIIQCLDYGISSLKSCYFLTTKIYGFVWIEKYRRLLWRQIESYWKFSRSVVECII